MRNNIIYKESYQYDIQQKNSPGYFHIDYGTRHFNINMSFQHFHPFYEVYVLLKGTSNHIIEGQLYPLQAFDVVVLKPYTLHKTQYAKNNPCQRLILNFSMDYIKKELLVDNDTTISKLFNDNIPVYRFDEKINNKLINIYNSIYLSSASDNFAKNLNIYSLFLQLLYEIFTNKQDNLYNLEGSLQGASKIHPITSFIHDNYNHNISLNSLSKQFFLSPYYLSHYFKKTTGFTIIQYTHYTRVKKAQQMLMETNLKSIEICQKCGFGSLSQFNRIFKRISKFSPQEYRKLYTLQ